MYKIKLSDGTIIDDLELNGNNYIPETKIDKNIFTNNLNNVVITDKDGNAEVLNNCKVLFTKVGTKQSFILIEKTKEEIEKEVNNAYIFDMDYRLTLREMGL